MRFLFILASAAMLGHAQKLDVKLGLWETTSTRERSGLPAVDTSKMNAQQKARVDAIMKGRGGEPIVTVVRQCVTKDSLDKLYQPQPSANASCTNTVVSGSRTAMHIKMTCSGDHPLNGDIYVEAISRESMKGSFDIAVTDSAHPMNMKSTMTSKWLGDACGDVK